MTIHTAKTAWPEGVIARYLTLAGATVDLTEYPTCVIATCTGCPNASWECSDIPTYGDRPNRGSATRQAANWAQTHAEACRALPRPTKTPAFRTAHV